MTSTPTPGSILRSLADLIDSGVAEVGSVTVMNEVVCIECGKVVQWSLGDGCPDRTEINRER